MQRNLGSSALGKRASSNIDGATQKLLDRAEVDDLDDDTGEQAKLRLYRLAIVRYCQAKYKIF